MLEGEWIDKVVNLQNVKAKYAQLVIPNSETCLELIQYYNPIGEKDLKTNKANQIGFRHMALEVKNIEEIYQKLKNRGVKIFQSFKSIMKKRSYVILEAQTI